MKTIKQLATGTFIAILLLAGNIKAEAAKTKVTNQVNMETTLQLENWMTDETVWNTNLMNTAGFSQEPENEMAFENWMTDSDYWNFNNNFVEETETDLAFENWMINDANWKVNNIDNEPELAVEQWMINESFWN